MTFRAYIEKRFGADALERIKTANAIIEEYQAKGYSLTLRQLYYQHVARGLIENNLKSYSRLGGLINDGRLAGLISWSAIEDRTRNLMGLPSYTSSGAKLRVDFFPCRGYVSQSEQWRAGRRLRNYVLKGQRPIIFHLGDHDPSGIDMTRDNRDRLSLFAGVDVTVVRLALNMEQIERYRPPPNPAKVTDSRFEAYQREYGDESWELDALNPEVIHNLIENNVRRIRDEKLWDAALAREVADKQDLEDMIDEMDSNGDNDDENEV